jgi:hypothetical protein
MKLCTIGDTTPLVHPKRYNMIPSANAIDIITSNTFTNNLEADVFLIQTTQDLKKIISALIEAVVPHLEEREQDYLDILIFIDADDETINFNSIYDMAINADSDERILIGIMTHTDLYNEYSNHHKNAKQKRRWIIECLSRDSDDETNTRRYGYEARIEKLINELHYNTLVPHNSKLFLDRGSIQNLNKMLKDIKEIRTKYYNMYENESDKSNESNSSILQKLFKTAH